MNTKGATGMSAYSVVVAALVVASLQSILVSAGPPDWVPPEIMDMIADDKARCMSEHGTTQAIIDKVNEGEIANDRSITCYMYCLLEAFSVADEDGNIDGDVLLSVLPDNLQTKAKQVMEACKGTTGSDPCDTVYNVAKCVQTQAPELWFVV